MAAIQWVIAVVVMLVTCAGPILSYPREVTAQETEVLGSSFTSTDVTPGMDLTTDAKVAENDLEEMVNKNQGEAGGMEDELNTDAVSSLQEASKLSTFEQILNVAMYAIHSYFTSDSLEDWLAGIGKVASYTETNGVARLFKFSPFVTELFEILEPYGFTPYPHPYEPIALTKNDTWRVILNWLALFGLISLFWRAYLPLPHFLQEKFGFLDETPHYEYYDPYDFEHYEHNDSEEHEEEEEEEEEEDEEEQDSYTHYEREDHDSYYTVGEEERKRNHESFAVFREEEPHVPSPHYVLGTYFTPEGSIWNRVSRKHGSDHTFPLSSSPSNGDAITSGQGTPRHASNRNRRKSTVKRPAHRTTTQGEGRRRKNRRLDKFRPLSSFFPFSLLTGK